ncbi:MAG: glycosyltransferase family 4 protein [Planctomycetota bacterium]
MRIALITEAWLPQVNGVVTTWTNVVRHMREWGHEVLVLHSGLFVHLRLPTYREVMININPGGKLRKMLDEFQPDAVHIATEGPLGMAGRSICVRRGWPFTTSFHTQFPKYLKKYFRVPKSWTYAFMRWFHHAGERILVPTQSVKDKLEKHGFMPDKVVKWCRGVDGEQFRPGDKSAFDALGLPRPVFLLAGRVAHEKNIPAFLELDLPGTKAIMGYGPMERKLKRRFPSAHFLGYQAPDDFARYMRSADVFVFPSKTDTFGLVMLEAMASGVPVAAFPTTGPRDVVTDGESGVLLKDLREAATRALAEIPPARCRELALQCTWEQCAQEVLDNLAPIRRSRAAVAEAAAPVEAAAVG